MSDIKVSVLTPLYNHAGEYVRKCLESLHTQTLQEIEFILIDNGANEENKALIAEYLKKDSRFRVLRFEENQGYGKAMNAGLASALGDYIGIVESDDFIKDYMYEVLYNNAIEKHADIAKSLFSFWEEANGITRQFVNTYSDNKYYKSLKNDNLPELPMYWAAQWAAIYRKTMLERNEILWSDVKTATHQDMGFMMKTWMAADNIVIIPDNLYFYRRDNENSSTYKNNLVAWGDAKEYDLLKFWMNNRSDLNKKLFWAIYCRREFLNKSYFYSQMTKKKFRYYLFEMSSKFKKHIRDKHVDFSIFSKEEAYKYKKIATHPLLFLLKSSFSLFTRKTTSSLECRKFLCLTYFKKKMKQNKTVCYYMGNFFKVIKTAKSICYYFLGIPVITKKDTVQKQYIKILGIPVYYKEDKNITIKNMFNLLQKQISDTNKFLIEQKKVNNLLNQKLSNMKCIVEASNLHPKTFGKYKNAFAGRDVVLVCTGPTAKNYKPIKDAIHVGVNGAVYMDNVQLDYLFVQDYTIKQQNNKELNKDCLEYKGNNCQKFFGIIPDERLAGVKHVIERIPLSYAYDENISQYIIEDMVKHNIAYDLSRHPIGDFCGTAFSALQFILYAHPKRLYLVGWDCSAGYAYDKPNAIRPANEQAEILKKYFVPFINLNYPDIEIISVNPVGLRGIFKDITM